MELKNIAKTLRKRPYLWFFPLIVIEILLRTMLGYLGPNPDLESWNIVGRVILSGETIYDNTARYNYGPFWGYLMGAVQWVVQSLGFDPLNLQPFHVIVSFLLGIVDSLIAVMVWRMYGLLPAVLFLLNPIAILLSGGHSQFDNLAVLMGLVAWATFLKSQSSASRKIYFLSAVLFGLSLSIKHILLFFPIWLLFFPDIFKKNVKLKFLHTITIFVVFLATFLFEILRDPSNQKIIEGILKNVIGYRGYGFSPATTLITLLVPISFITSLTWVPLFKGFTLLYVVTVTLVGYILSKRKLPLTYTYPLYLLTFVAASPSVANQYFAIALIPIALFINYWPAFIFNIIAFVFLSSNNWRILANAGNSYPVEFEIGNFAFPLFPWNIPNPVEYQHVQSWLILLLAVIILTIPKTKPEKFFVKIPKYKYIISIIIFIYFTVMLMAYSAVKQIGELENKASLVSVRHISCNSEKSVYPKLSCARQNGCKLNIPPRFSKQCSTEKYVIRWTCSKQKIIHPVFTQTINPSHKKTSLRLECPVNLQLF